MALMFHHETVNHNLLLPCGIGSTPEQAARHRRAPSISVDQATSAHLTGSWTKLCGQSGSPGGLNPVMRWPPPLSLFTKTDGAKALDVRWLFGNGYIFVFQNGLCLSQQILRDLHIFLNPVIILIGLYFKLQFAFGNFGALWVRPACTAPPNRVHTLAAGISSQTRKVSSAFSQVLLSWGRPGCQLGKKFWT